MNEWLQFALLLAVLVAAPVAIGAAAGKLLGGLRGRAVGVAVPIVGWTLRLVYDFGLPRSSDSGPEPATEVKQWIAACAVTGCLAALAAIAFDRQRAKAGPGGAAGA